MIHTFEQSGIILNIDLNADQYGNLNLTAHPTDQPELIAHGRIPGVSNRSYPRVEFNRYCRTRYDAHNFETGSPWLLTAADHRYKSLDDHQAPGDVANEPVNRVEFDITAEIDTINALRFQPVIAADDTPEQTPTTPQPKTTPAFGNSGLGIDGLAHHNETPIIPSPQALTRYEKLQAQATTCRRCRQTDTINGAMFTTDPDSGLCDDCC